MKSTSFNVISLVRFSKNISESALLNELKYKLYLANNSL